MKRVLCFSLLVTALFLLVQPACAEEKGRFGWGVNLGLINNFRIWTRTTAESGSVVQVSYAYDFSDFYTAQLELGFFVDSNLFRNANVTTYTDSGSYLNIDHLFRPKKFAKYSPYFKFGTGLYAINNWEKTGNTFTFVATNVVADVSAGAGLDVEMQGGLFNLDLAFPALVNELYGNKRLAYILTFGFKHYI